MDSAMFGQANVFWAPASYQAAPAGMPGAFAPAPDGYSYGPLPPAGPYLQPSSLYAQAPSAFVGHGYQTAGHNAATGFVSSSYAPFQGAGFAGVNGNGVAWEPAPPYATPFPPAHAAPPVAAPSYAYQGYQGFNNGPVGPFQGQPANVQIFAGPYDHFSGNIGQAGPPSQAYEYNYVSAAGAAPPAQPPAPLPAAQALPARLALGPEYTYYPISNSAGKMHMQEPSGDGRANSRGPLALHRSLQLALPSPRPTLSFSKRPSTQGPSSPLAAAAKRSRTYHAAAATAEHRAAARPPHSPSVAKASPKAPAAPKPEAEALERRSPAPCKPKADSAAAEGKEEAGEKEGGAAPVKRRRGDSEGRPIPISSGGNARRLAMRVNGGAESYMRCLDYRTFESVLSLGCDIAWALFPDPRTVEGEPITVVLVDSEGREWPCKYHTLVCKHSYVLRNGWRTFVEAHGVAKNDIVVLSKDEQNLDDAGQAKVRISIVPRKQAKSFMANKASHLSAAAQSSSQEDPAAAAAAAAHAEPDPRAVG